MKNLFILLRPHQWLKNLFVFLPAFFDRHITDPDYLLPSLAVFVAFCFAASGIYCLNDIIDADADRMHPVKKLRPIASRAISKTSGYMLMILCLLLSIAIIAVMDNHAAADTTALIVVVGIYIVMNIAYCLWLKHVAIVDVFIIATGFVLRIFAGGHATAINLSSWLVLMTFLIALFLAFAKRRDDVVIYESTGLLARKNVGHYNITFMNQIIAIIASITIVCYIMYTVSPEVIQRFHSSYIYTTSVFVLAGIIRYLQLTIVDDKSGSPTRVLLTDRFIHTCIAGWILAFFVIIYLS